MTLDELYAVIEKDLNTNFQVNGTNTFNLLTGERRHSDYLATLSYYFTVFHRAEPRGGPFRLRFEDKARIAYALQQTALFSGWGSGEDEDALAILQASGVDAHTPGLYDADTNELIGMATTAQIVASDQAAQHDGGAGIILVMTDGTPVNEGTWGADQPGVRRVYANKII